LKKTLFPVIALLLSILFFGCKKNVKSDLTASDELSTEITQFLNSQKTLIIQKESKQLIHCKLHLIFQNVTLLTLTGMKQ